MAERAAALLPGDLPALRRVPAAQLHLTLAFIGSVPVSAIVSAGAALRAAAAAAVPITVRLEHQGRFPQAGPAAVLWLGASVGAPALGELALRLRAELGVRGVPHDAKPFRPHVTLARVRQAGRVETDAIGALPTSLPPVALDFRADRVHLVESVLARGGARYTLLEEAMLGGIADTPSRADR